MTTHPGLDQETATTTHCHTCAAPIIQATTDGLTIRANPTLLTLTQEIRAHLTGHTTYELAAQPSGRYELIRRTPSRIRHQPDTPVVANHHCTAPRIDWRQATKLPPPVPLTIRAGLPAVGDTPPF